MTYLTDLFEHLPHPATYAAIRRLAPYLDVDTIRAMVEFRDAWLQNDSWHLHRYGREIAVAGTHTGGFTWKLAYRLCESRSEYPPDMMIDDDWITEWLHLQPGAKGYYDFAAFVARKLERDDGLHVALSQYELYEDPDKSKHDRVARSLLAFGRPRA